MTTAVRSVGAIRSIGSIGSIGSILTVVPLGAVPPLRTIRVDRALRPFGAFRAVHLPVRSIQSFDALESLGEPLVGRDDGIRGGGSCRLGADVRARRFDARTVAAGRFGSWFRRPTRLLPWLIGHRRRLGARSWRSGLTFSSFGAGGSLRAFGSLGTFWPWRLPH